MKNFAKGLTLRWLRTHTKQAALQSTNFGQYFRSFSFLLFLTENFFDFDTKRSTKGKKKGLASESRQALFFRSS
ncbi:hypothetical protein [Comamonas sp. C24C]